MTANATRSTLCRYREQEKRRALKREICALLGKKILRRPNSRRPIVTPEVWEEARCQ